ncbi:MULTISPECIES: putative glycoside hydrolase [Bacillus amyloliquefaciens group]|uniref:putative glycoside hydrolase n=1 Tax=Bacillus amyloliquefaciens group TaxID=1938374 RepID=UPI000709D24B|nr:MULTISPECIES: putative glycoside hydrolase [Bacillus amyloliquefaciens group]PAE78185.1 GTP-binding protein [Bacillus velezensis]UMU14332.1 GTP-binding protein [Bacillus velezensis]WKW09928.1 putative glycoside hydrolase [Bacillus velezensis]
MKTIFCAICAGLFISAAAYPAHAAVKEEQPLVKVALAEKELPKSNARFAYPSGLHFSQPDKVRGIYVTGHSAGGSKFGELTDFVDKTELNTMVIDVKDDNGNLTFKPDGHSEYAKIAKPYIKDPKKMMKKLEEKKIYPIARIVVFKDSELANKKPEWSFKEKNGSVWKNGRGESFVNPFMKEVWDYNVKIAKQAVKMGFQEIQFDYVRFPEGFEKRDDELTYGHGDYGKTADSNVQKRVHAVTDFVGYAKKKLKPYGADVSVDIFGYSATLPEAPGIGQNFSKISDQVDVISSMIYPSHWTSYFGIDKPDLEPYNVVKEYAKVENKKLSKLKHPPVSRPWLQDFTASYLGSGNYQKYGKRQVEDQVKALHDEGIDEFLLWDAANRYTKNVDYTPF